MFRITQKKGFHITFENGYTVSVQFGPGNYCANYDKQIGDDDEAAGKEGSVNAECAVFVGNNNRGSLTKVRGWDDTVKGYMTPKEVLNLLKWAERQKPLVAEAKP